jgi:hypothetical protein
MHQRVDLQGLWREAMRDAARSLRAHGDQALPGLPEDCPLSLAEFLAADFDIDGAVDRLRPAA